MKNPLNFSQLLLLSHNGSSARLADFFTFQTLTDVFFSHVHSSCLRFDQSILLVEPFLSAEFQESVQSSTVCMNDTPLGEFFLFHHSIPAYRSLVYCSSTVNQESTLLNESLLQTWSVRQYTTFIETFSSTLMDEKKRCTS